MTKKPVVLVAAFLCIVLSLSVPALAAPQDVKVDRSQWDAITSGAGYSTKGIQVNVQEIVNKLKTWETSYFNPMVSKLSDIASNTKSAASYLNSINGNTSNASTNLGSIRNDVAYIRNNLPSGGGGGAGFDYRDVLHLIQEGLHNIRLDVIALSGDVTGIKNNTASIRTDTSAIHSDTSSIADSVPIIQNALFAKWHPQRPPASVAELVAMVWRQLEIDLHGYAVDNGVKQQVTIGSLVADLRNSLANKVDQEIRDNVSEDANAYKDHFSTKPNKDNIGGMSGVSDGASKWFSTDVSIADAGGMFDQFDQNLAGWFSGTTANQISVGGADAAFYRDFDYYVAPDTPDLDSWLDEAHRIAGGLSG